MLRGTAQNPDTFFQAREAANLFYRACPAIVERADGRDSPRDRTTLRLFDYVGHPDAERVIVIMGSGAETVHETVDFLAARGEKVGVLKVRLFRPFAIAAFLHVLPRSVRAIAVLDRTKEPGALGEPLYQDVVTALAEARAEGSSPFAAEPRVVGGRYGLSSKEFTPAMVKAVFDNLAQPRPKNHFTIGIVDDVTQTSLPYDDTFDIEPAMSPRARLLRSRRRWHGRRQQELDQDHRRGDRPVRTGLLRLRLEEGGRDDGLAPAHEPAPDPVRVPDPAGAVRGLPPVRVPRPDRRARTCRRRGGVPAERARTRPTRSGQRLPREVQQQIIDKHIRFYAIDAVGGGPPGGHGRPHQHDHADLLLCDLRRAAARRGDRADQAGDREDLPQAWSRRS